MAKTPADHPNHPRGRVLVVDDQASSRSALEDLLKDEGFDVTLAAGGQEALDRCAADEFDVILLDLWMPQIGGLDVLKELQRRGCPAEILVLTGHGTISAAIEAIKLGAMDFLLKPWTVHDMGEKVAQAVEVKRQKPKGSLHRAFQLLARESRLTEKQVLVCKHLVAGRSNQAIARALEISEHTVKTHLKNIFARLGVKSRTELVARVVSSLEQS
ncbi:MAG: response regulator transcription factor [Candidatus Sumerlaeota bacterium]|nr:response regulator transcription factor [Candidatus Sumerlaeota bacterium]